MAKRRKKKVRSGPLTWFYYASGVGFAVKSVKWMTWTAPAKIAQAATAPVWVPFWAANRIQRKKEFRERSGHM